MAAERAEVARLPWQAATLRLRSKTRRCPGGEEQVLALVDGDGQAVVLTRRYAARSDLRLYADDGPEIGVVRMVDGTQVDVVLPP